MATQVPVKKTRETRPTETTQPWHMLEEMEHWAESMMPRGWMRPFQFERPFWAGAMPHVDLIDSEEQIVLRAAVPGFGKDDIEVSATEDSVTIRGQMKRETQEMPEGGEYYRREIRSEDFLRTVHLPCTVDDTKAKATFRDGMLELMLPKAEHAKRHTLKIEEI